MERLASAMARAVRGMPGQVWLHGDLGVGKTTFCRAWIQALLPGVRVKSPTFSLLEPYEGDDCRICHLDLYRIDDVQELEYLGLRDWLARDQLLVEWPERGWGFLPPPALRLWLQPAEAGRCLTVECDAPAWRQALGPVLESFFGECENHEKN